MNAWVKHSINRLFLSTTINRVFHSGIHGSRDIVADAKKNVEELKPRWELVLELFREPLEIDLIYQLRKCSPCCEEQSINRVFHSNMPGSRVIAADITKKCRGWKPLGPCTWIISRTIRERSNMSISKCSPCWEEQSINRVFHSVISRSRVRNARVKYSINRLFPLNEANIFAIDIFDLSLMVLERIQVQAPSGFQFLDIFFCISYNNSRSRNARVKYSINRLFLSTRRTSLQLTYLIYL